MLFRLLAFVFLFSSVSFAGDYRRADYGRWIDADGDCQNTRQEILIRDSLIPVSFSGEDKCRVSRGKWFDPYTGLTFSNPLRLDIDHIVPLGEAHESGASSFAAAKKREFRNDEKNLIAVSSSSNRSKGDRDPSKWMPTNRLFWEEYAILWVRTKIRWGLSFDEAESIKLDCLLGRGQCK